MNVNDFKKDIETFFNRYGKIIVQTAKPLEKGKIYELYCLSRTVKELKSRYGLFVIFNGKGRSIDFKASPGKLDRNKSYFVLQGRMETFELHTDIEFLTLGIDLQANARPLDRSQYHEIDIMVLKAGVLGRPKFSHLALGVECKAHANFSKQTLKQVLGVRRELSLVDELQPTKLATASKLLVPRVRAAPPSEYWLAYPDPGGNHYKESPNAFGIEFKHWCP